jgi:hypothetical protein
LKVDPSLAAQGRVDDNSLQVAISPKTKAQCFARSGVARRA